MDVTITNHSTHAARAAPAQNHLRLMTKSGEGTLEGDNLDARAQRGGGRSNDSSQGTEVLTPASISGAGSRVLSTSSRVTGGVSARPSTSQMQRAAPAVSAAATLAAGGGQGSTGAVPKQRGKKLPYISDSINLLTDAITNLKTAPTPSVGTSDLRMRNLILMQKDCAVDGDLKDDELDFLLWKGEPKDLCTTLSIPGFLNYSDMGKDMKLKLQSYWVSETKGATAIKFEHEMVYPIYLEERSYVEIVPSILHKMGNKGDMLHVISNADASLGMSHLAIRGVLGTNYGTLSAESLNQLSYMQSTRRDMRLLALKAVMLLRQLTIIRTSERNSLRFQAIPYSYALESLTPMEVLDSCQYHSVLIDVTGISDLQRRILLRICNTWPSQKLVWGAGEVDRYAACMIPSEKFKLYVSDGRPAEINCEGITESAHDYWSQVLNLFNGLGCLNDLIDVVRDTRGLAPILTAIAKLKKDGITVGVLYPPSRIYHGLTSVDKASIHFTSPTLLESSSYALTIDMLMQTVFFNNCLFMTETLGLGCTQLIRNDRPTSRRLTDIFMAHGFGLDGFNHAANDTIMPWLVPLCSLTHPMFTVLELISRCSSNGTSFPLVYVPLHWGLPTIWGVSSVALIKGDAEVAPMKVSGKESTVAHKAFLLALANWVVACQGVYLPKYGASMIGSEVSASMQMIMGGMWQYNAVYSHDRIALQHDYPHMREISGSISGTFFRNNKYIRAIGVAEERELQEVQAPNTFSMLPGKMAVVPGADGGVAGSTNVQTFTHDGTLAAPEHVEGRLSRQMHSSAGQLVDRPVYGAGVSVAPPHLSTPSAHATSPVAHRVDPYPQPQRTDGTGVQGSDVSQAKLLANNEYHHSQLNTKLTQTPVYSRPLQYHNVGTPTVQSPSSASSDMSLQVSSPAYNLHSPDYHQLTPSNLPPVNFSATMSNQGSWADTE